MGGILIMDREDARFVAAALESRISRARVELEQLAASSLVRLSSAAQNIDQRNPFPGRWRPAVVAAEELRFIGMRGENVADIELEPARLADLNTFLATLKKLIDEPPVAPPAPANRAERRALVAKQAKLIKRARGLTAAGPLELIR